MTAQPLENTDDAIDARLLGAHINAWRHKTFITQTALGEAIGVSQSTMAKKLRGLVPITAVELYGLARALEVDVIDLLPPADFLVRKEREVRRQGLEPRTRCYGVKRPDLRVYEGGLSVNQGLTANRLVAAAPALCLVAAS